MKVFVTMTLIGLGVTAFAADKLGTKVLILRTGEKTLKIELVTNKKGEPLYSSICISDKNCGAFKAAHDDKIEDVPQTHGLQPGVMECEYKGGRVESLQDEKYNMYSFCGFDDGTYIDLGLYARLRSGKRIKNKKEAKE